MPTFQFNKLVRDKFRPIYDQLGQTIKTRELSRDQLKDAIRNKIIEEAKELPIDSVSAEDISSELADIQQALDDLADKCGISSEQIAKKKIAKFAEKGGFSEGLFVETITLNDNDKWVQYYRNEPDKYPEI